MSEKMINLSGLGRFLDKLKSLFVAKSGSAMTGDLTTTANINFTVKNKGVYGTDRDGFLYPYARDNGSNLWIGAMATKAQHHRGGTYISAGYDGTNGYSTINICVPNADNTNGTNYQVYHTGFKPGKADVGLGNADNTADLDKPISTATQAALDDKVNVTDIATDTDYGIVKLNPNESVTLNASGQLDVGGRLGAFPGTTGIFHPKTADPRALQSYSFFITDAKGLNVNAARVFGIFTGFNLTLNKSHTAGSTVYTIANNYENRIRCSVLANGGYLALDEADSKAKRVTFIESVTIGGQPFTPDSSANNGSKPITITVATSVNPDSDTTTIRAFGAVTGGYCSQYIGQDVGGASGCSLVIGQNAISKAGNGNIMIGMSLFNDGNGNSIFGRLHISRKNRWLIAGQGHDTTNGTAEAGTALGQWSSISSNTAFAVGGGTSATNRLNLFEVLSDGGMVLRSPNGTRYKISVDDSGNLTTTAIT